MSTDLFVYAKDVSDALIPSIIAELNAFEMVCEIHPEFSFEGHSGFLPFKFELQNPPVASLKGKSLLSGFELYIEDFDFAAEKEDVGEDIYATEELDPILAQCTKNLIFTWHGDESFEMRFAQLTSAIVAKLCNGVRYHTATGDWHDNSVALQQDWQEIQEYEKSLTEETVSYHEFEGWN